MVQPIIVRKLGERYSIVAESGAIARRASRLSHVPVIIKEFDDAEVHEVALVENLQRENLNPMEEAAAIRFLMQQHDLTQEEVSQRLGKSRPVIANSLRLLNLPEDVQRLVREGELSSGHARAVAGIRDEAKLRCLAFDAARYGWSVRDVEHKVAALNVKEAPGAAGADQSACGRRRICSRRRKGSARSSARRSRSKARKSAANSPSSITAGTRSNGSTAR